MFNANSHFFVAVSLCQRIHESTVQQSSDTWGNMGKVILVKVTFKPRQQRCMSNWCGSPVAAARREDKVNDDQLPEETKYKRKRNLDV